jgi:hypothetical protein
VEGSPSLLLGSLLKGIRAEEKSSFLHVEINENGGGRGVLVSICRQKGRVRRIFMSTSRGNRGGGGNPRMLMAEAQFPQSSLKRISSRGINADLVPVGYNRRSGVPRREDPLSSSSIRQKRAKL